MKKIGYYKTRRTCRFCKSKDLVQILDLGKMPLAGNFLSQKEVGKELYYPLKVFFCTHCALVQIRDIIEAPTLFSDYRYLSSTTATLRDHFLKLADIAFKRFLKPRDLTVEIGSNDGVLQAPLQQLGIIPLGIDPATNIVKHAKEKGLPIINKFFNSDVAKKIVKEYGKAKICFASNVFAHIDDLDEILEGVKIVLQKNGIFLVEVHYLVELLDKLQYDAIYHEHLCYYSVTSLSRFFTSHDMIIFEVEQIPIHAGSLRLYITSKYSHHQVSTSVIKFLKKEAAMGITNLDLYKRFETKVRNQKIQLRKLLESLKKRKKTVAGYGAAGRGNTLLNYCGINVNDIPYTVDRSTERAGRFLPQSHIPVLTQGAIKPQQLPDYFLLLAWSYFKEIKKNEKQYLRNGGKFILPLPKVKVYS